MYYSRRDGDQYNGPILSFLEGRMTEGDYQSVLIKKIKKRFPNVVVIKNDPTYIQGFPDLLLLRGNKWAALEVKKDRYAHHQPNQDYYINRCKDMGSYSSFIFPENEKEVLDELERAFKS
jgi:hypothetical protein